ncbi:response regulator [Sphingomonas kyeonggiensis]|uniref:response regulator n=1 Tax=Sphingomonas kyeonggiensis TaxID=1268553 RepID=UPI0027D77AE7|nr:response regulator [Sphingomonas kyeonggiensis]
MPTASPPHRRILLLENDEAVRRSLAMLLKISDFEVRGYDRIASLIADPMITQAEWLIAGDSVSDGTAIEALAALRERGWFGRAALMTATHSVEFEHAARACGYGTVLAKPILQRELLHLLTDGDRMPIAAGIAAPRQSQPASRV